MTQWRYEQPTARQNIGYCQSAIETMHKRMLHNNEVRSTAIVGAHVDRLMHQLIAYQIRRVATLLTPQQKQTTAVCIEFPMVHYEIFEAFNRTGDVAVLKNILRLCVIDHVHLES